MALRARIAAALVALALLAGPAAASIFVSFDHGVASGDPFPTSIVLWTRITPRNLLQQTSYTPIHALPAFVVKYNVYADQGLTQLVTSGSQNTTIDRDYTVKVIVDGLQPNSTYFYNFVAQNGSVVSPTGKFKLPPTAGAPLSSLKFFYFSCSNWPTGYFNAYDHASKYDLDFWIHLGDYYYEYGISSGTGDIRWQPPPLGLSPSGDIQVLDDYRKRHALYRTDPGLQNLAASAALIAIWDDHEFMNNVYADGAQNEYPGEVEFYQRKQNAMRAYTEWMPIRWNFTNTPRLNQYEDYAINRTFQFGNLGTLFMLEDRVTVRTQAGEDSNEFDPTENPDSQAFARGVVGDLNVSAWANGGNATVDKQMTDFRDKLNKRRTNESDLMVGPSQLAWIEKETNASTANKTTWQLYSTGIVLQDWFWPDLLGALAQNMAPNSAVASYWQEAFNNATTPGTTYMYLSTSASNQDKYGTVQNVTAADAAAVRGAAALGKYKVNSDADSWQGYLYDRYRFGKAIRNALNPTIYTGDSHNFWAGYFTARDPLDYVNKPTEVPTEPVIATEFDGGSVTSNGYESDPHLPLDFVNAAWMAANPNMFHVELRYRGGVYVELTPTNQHVEFTYVNTVASQDYVGFCGKAFDVPARTSLDQKITAKIGNCSAGPNVGPYSASGSNAVLRTPYRIQGQKQPIKAGTMMPTDPFLNSS